MSKRRLKVIGGSLLRFKIQSPYGIAKNTKEEHNGHDGDSAVAPLAYSQGSQKDNNLRKDVPDP